MSILFRYYHNLYRNFLFEFTPRLLQEIREVLRLAFFRNSAHGFRTKLHHFDWFSKYRNNGVHDESSKIYKHHFIPTRFQKWKSYGMSSVFARWMRPDWTPAWARYMYMGSWNQELSPQISTGNSELKYIFLLNESEIAWWSGALSDLREILHRPRSYILRSIIVVPKPSSLSIFPQFRHVCFWSQSKSPAWLLFTLDVSTCNVRSANRSHSKPWTLPSAADRVLPGLQFI